MLIEQKLEDQNVLSGNEYLVAKYILAHREEMKHISISDISKATFTSLSTTVRLSQKLGYSGFKEFKEAFLEEQEYLHTHFEKIDPNIPFQKENTIQDISSILAHLLQDSIQDSYELLHHDSLQRAVQYLNDADTIYIFAITNTASITYDFQYKMMYLGKKVVIVENPEFFSFTFLHVTKNDCCLFISYSGETFEIYHVKKYLKGKNMKTISITSLGENSLVGMTDVHLFISTREKLSSKIGHFVSNESIHYILDVLYACIFAKDYEKNIKEKFDLAKEIDYERYSSTSILQEKEV